MRKTSVYLPEPLKASLERLARRSGRSEAELLRLAVERLVSGDGGGPEGTAERSAPRPGPRLVGVGVGPGPADLLTARAVASLRAADRVFVGTTGPDAIGRAEAVLRAALPDVEVDRLPLAVAAAPEERAASLRAAAERVVAALDAGEVVALATLGDPLLWSAFPAVARHVTAARPDVPVEAVPGLLAYQELAARTGTVLAEDDGRVTLVALTADPPADVLEGRGALVVAKGGRHLPALAERLRSAGREDGAVVGELLGQPGERIAAVAAVAGRPASYLATVVVPAVGAASPPPQRVAT